jgi:hypothetical protein
MRPEKNAAGELVFVGVGKKTVDVYQTKERFAGLGIQTKWNLLDKITEARNDLEHYIPKHSKSALEGLIANAFAIIRDFVTRELEEDPLHLLGEATWQAMLDVSNVYEEELSACEAAKEAIDWQSEALQEGVSDLSCQECGSDLLRPTEVQGETLIECSRWMFTFVTEPLKKCFNEPRALFSVSRSSRVTGISFASNHSARATMTPVLPTPPLPPIVKTTRLEFVIEHLPEC